MTRVQLDGDKAKELAEEIKVFLTPKIKTPADMGLAIGAMRVLETAMEDYLIEQGFEVECKVEML